MTAAGAPREEQTGRGAVHVGAGILASRIFGLIRQRALAHYLGLSFAADAFNAAFRIPNFLQNLFGEGVLSASFIPVYARLIAEGDEAEATRTAGAIGTLLTLTTAVLVLIGVLATPLLIGLIAPGFTGDKRQLTIVLVQILFPGAGLLVISAWCLGIQNSHRKFLLSYSAPIVWNLAIIVALVAKGRTDGPAALAVVAAGASVVGSALQLLVQLPTVFRLVPRIAPSIGRGSEHVRTVIRNFVPVFVGRGVVQISAYVDTMIASFLPGGAVAALASAQVLYTLPVSLFGMAVSAAELPAMSSVAGERDEIAAALRTRLERGLRRIAFFVAAVRHRVHRTGRHRGAVRSSRPAGSRMPTRSTCGASWPARPLDCSHPRWAACTHRRITRCATRARRSASPPFASSSRWCWGFCSRSRCRSCSASTRRGAPPASPRRRASLGGWNSHSCAGD